MKLSERIVERIAGYASPYKDWVVSEMQADIMDIQALEDKLSYTRNIWFNVFREELRQILQEEHDRVIKDEDGFAEEAPDHICGELNALLSIARRFGISFYNNNGETIARIDK